MTGDEEFPPASILILLSKKKMNRRIAREVFVIPSSVVWLGKC